MASLATVDCNYLKDGPKEMKQILYHTNALDRAPQHLAKAVKSSGQDNGRVYTRCNDDPLAGLVEQQGREGDIDCLQEDIILFFSKHVYFNISPVIEMVVLSIEAAEDLQIKLYKLDPCPASDAAISNGHKR